MRRVPLAGLKCRGILPKMVGVCLADSLLDLPHRWPEKVRAVVLGICLARSTVLQDIARALGGPVKKSEKALSEFLRERRRKTGTPCIEKQLGSSLSIITLARNLCQEHRARDAAQALGKPREFWSKVARRPRRANHLKASRER